METLTKTCPKCGEDKELHLFTNDRTKRDGKSSWCRACNKARLSKRYAEHPEWTTAATIAWRAKNPGRHEAANAAWYEANKDLCIARATARNRERPEEHLVACAKYVRDNQEKEKARRAKYTREHPVENCIRASKRRAAKLQATPAWANEFFIEEAYALAKLRADATGIVWEVDHIVPLVNKKVCGLHVEFNLQVIPRRVNRRKGNRVWPDMPEQGVRYDRLSSA